MCVNIKIWVRKTYSYIPDSKRVSGGSRISRRGGVHSLGGRGPPMWPLFDENVCKNERIGSHRGGGVHWARPLDPPKGVIFYNNRNFHSVTKQYSSYPDYCHWYCYFENFKLAQHTISTLNGSICLEIHGYIYGSPPLKVTIRFALIQNFKIPLLHYKNAQTKPMTNDGISQCAKNSIGTTADYVCILILKYKPTNLVTNVHDTHDLCFTKCFLW